MPTYFGILWRGLKEGCITEQHLPLGDWHSPSVNQLQLQLPTTWRMVAALQALAEKALHGDHGAFCAVVGIVLWTQSSPHGTLHNVYNIQNTTRGYHEINVIIIQTFPDEELICYIEKEAESILELKEMDTVASIRQPVHNKIKV
jgi:hypothetical protein